jgi:hypothetical protein
MPLESIAPSATDLLLALVKDSISAFLGTGVPFRDL